MVDRASREKYRYDHGYRPESHLYSGLYPPTARDFAAAGYPYQLNKETQRSDAARFIIEFAMARDRILMPFSYTYVFKTGRLDVNLTIYLSSEDDALWLALSGLLDEI